VDHGPWRASVALVRPSTDCSGIVDEGLALVEEEIHLANLSDNDFVPTTIKGCVAIIKEQVESDLPPLKAALETVVITYESPENSLRASLLDE
jgi:hypothetical protein